MCFPSQEFIMMIGLLQKCSVVCLNSVASLKRENSRVFHQQQAPEAPEAPVGKSEAPAVQLQQHTTSLFIVGTSLKM